MSVSKARLTVYFEPPFWVALYQREQRKTERKVISKEQREAQRERKLALRQEKRREKHRGH